MLNHTRNYFQMFSTFLFVVMMAAASDQAVSSVLQSDNRHYTYVYWENGFPTLPVTRRPQAWANNVARNEPVVVLQTGYYSLALNCSTLDLVGFDSVEGSDYISALTEDVTQFSQGELVLSVVKNGVSYTATTGQLESDDGHSGNVRLIESGQFLKRLDHVGLSFEAEDGSQLDLRGRLEISVWPEQAVFKLDFNDFDDQTNEEDQIEKTSIELITPTGKKLVSSNEDISTALSIRPHEEIYTPVINPESIVVSAQDLQHDRNIISQYDSDTSAIKFVLPVDAVRFPEHNNRFDSFVFELKNSSDEPIDIPLVFEERAARAVTGTVMSLTDPEDDSPLGLAVQISKNWHNNSQTGIDRAFMGTWLRGSTYLSLAAGESKKIKLNIIFGHWGDTAAVSHSHLSLIGWGARGNSNWKWDESALGAWGESMTYDPTQGSASAFIADVRPSYTFGIRDDQYNWTENVGGGDFLVYFDANNQYRWPKKVKTAYQWTGPKVTKVLYSGVTDDDKIRFSYQTQLIASNDYHRRIHRYRYTFLESVVAPKQLVFYQTAANYYPGPSFNNYAIGDINGLVNDVTVSTGVLSDTGHFSFNNRWLSINDLDAIPGSAKANRGIIQRYSKLNGEVLPVYMHKTRSDWGSSSSMLFNLSTQNMAQSYDSGDVVEGEYEFVLTPKNSELYWGPDAEFANRLNAHSSSWNAVFDEFIYNDSLSVKTRIGQLESEYPVSIAASAASQNQRHLVLTDFILNKGGIGHVPIIIKKGLVGKPIKVQRFVDGAWEDYEAILDFGVHYFQSYKNKEGLLDHVFTIKRPSDSLESSWRLRVLYDEPIDRQPDALHFPIKYFAKKNSVINSPAVTISGINMPTRIYIKNGEYSINGRSFTSDIGRVMNGDTLVVRHTAGGQSNEQMITALVIGSSPLIFSSVTPVAIDRETMSKDERRAARVASRVSARKAVRRMTRVMQRQIDRRAARNAAR